MIDELREALNEVAESSEHHGYWYSVQGVLAIMICGLLCGLQNVEDIHQWARVERSRAFFKDVFALEKIPCRAQIYNILSRVNANFFEKCFTKWMRKIVQGKNHGKTVAIDGKSIRSTSNTNSGRNR